MLKIGKPFGVGAMKLATAVSALFNPLVSLVAYFIYHSIRYFNLAEALRYFLPVLLIILLPAVLWISIMVKTGRYTNLDVSDRLQRRSLYFFLEFLMAGYLVWAYLVRCNLDLVLLFVLVLTIALQLSNYFIKSSMHTAFNVYTCALFLAEDLRWGTAWAVVTLLVAISRIVLKRHTVSEVFSGFFIAAFVSIVYLYINIQIMAQR